MFGGLLGALMSGVGLAINAGNQQTANAINWRAVMEQVRANQIREQQAYAQQRFAENAFNEQQNFAEDVFKQQTDLAEADRYDAYGNKIGYDPYRGFQYDLTPLTAAILSGQQQEQLRSLREDAPRNRAAAERMDARSQMGDDAFEEMFNNFRYRPRRSEDEYIADAQTLALNSRERGLTEAANDMAQQLLRTGNTSNVAKVYAQQGNEYAKGLTDALLQAKQVGRQNYQADTAFDTQQGEGELSFLKGIADQTSTSPVNAGTYNSDLTGRGDNAMQQLLAALVSGGQNVLGSMQTGSKNVLDVMSGNQALASKDTMALVAALNNAAQGFGQQLDFSGIANALAKINFGGADPKTGSSGGQDFDKQFANPFALQGVNAFGQAVNSDPWAGLRGVI